MACEVEPRSFDAFVELDMNCVSLTMTSKVADVLKKTTNGGNISTFIPCICFLTYGGKMSTFIPWTATVLGFRAFDAVLEMFFS